MARFPLGVFDSGVGGLSVLREIQRLLPHEEILYFADQAHVPHGSRTQTEVRGFCFAVADYLLRQNAKLIVVACNTDSAAALKPLRERYPDTPFVGMEPAVKPAVARTQTGVVGVIATPTTFQGELFANTVDRFAQNVRVLTQTMPGLVEMVEQGEVSGPRVEALLRERLAPLQAEHIGSLVLGCTHYPFVRESIASVLGPDVPIIDPSPAIARQVERVLYQHRLLESTGEGSTKFITSGDPSNLARSVLQLLGQSAPAHQATWENDVLR
jgi:glutamate racemase